MKRVLFGLFAALVMLAGCHAPGAVEEKPQQQTSTPVRLPPVETEAACKAQKGEWTRVCLMGNYACVNAYADGGKSCSDSSECGSNRCSTKDTGTRPGSPTKGVCAPTDNPCGCFQLVEKGVAGYPLCAD